MREDAGVYFPGRAIYNEPIRINKGEYNLPHWELDATIYHVCFRLNDSVPMQKQMEWKREREWIIENAHLEKRELTEYEKKRLQYLYSDKIDAYLDAGYGECILRNPDVANIVQNSLNFYNGKKYRLHSWCIMPNHVHIAFQLLEHYRLSEVLQGWKSFTAHTINKFLGRTGVLWQSDCYNHIIRTENEYYQQLRYIWHNPDKAGLSNWQWRWICID
ncbi:MAG: transposase [Victivallales bacterium]|nr:transposase [Victivallales bacterium]